MNTKDREAERAAERPWEIMDDWCKRQSVSLAELSNDMIERGVSLDDREFRRVLGHCQMIGRMRSFIRGARGEQ